ncbi:hypothetical protein ACMFMG_012057 [Clarireedia jacksonii]
MEPATGESSNRPLRLLSLDGGGIRGISELVILEEIMHRVGRSQNLPTLLPADYFDMICGTSTGGLIALLLGRLRLSVPEAIDKYRLLAKKVFSDKKSRGKDGCFKASSLEKAIKDVVEEKLGRGHTDEKMFIFNRSSCKTFVCAVPAIHINKQPRLFRTWSADKNPGYNCTIWEAARATSAAPRFFKRIDIGDPGLQEEFIDAGIGCNNPVRYLVEEAGKEFGPERMVSCIVSIGTGKPKVAGFKAPGLFQRVLPLELIQVLADMVTDTEAEASAMEARFQNCPGLYHRLNVERGLEEVSLEEWEKLGEVKQHTMAYLSDNAVSRRIDVIVDALVGKSQQVYPLGQLDGAVAALFNTHHYFLYPTQQVLYYVTRKDPFSAIHQRFQKPPDKTVPTVVVLLGMGGCGKSQLALEYCRQGQNEKWFSTILWLDASSPMSIAQSFTNIANKLSKPNFDIADDKGNIRFVLDTIEAWKFRWLLVFDNFDDPSSFGNTSIKEYFPQGRYGSILFTSRHTVAKSLGFYIEVTTMSNEEALQLLLERSQAEKTSTNRQEGANIVKRLGYHALAIDQAGAYILARGLDLNLYMTHYTERKERVLNEVPELWDYKRKLKTDTEVETKLSVFTTWELSIELISGSPDARKDKDHLLTLAGFLDGKEVPDELFRCYSSRHIDWLVSCLRGGVWDKYEAQDILKEFQNLSLLQNLHIGKDETTFSLHPLIQDWVKLRVDLNARRAYTREAILVLSAFFKFQSVNNMKLKTKQTLLSHLEAVLQNENDYTVLRDNLEETELLDATFEFGAFFLAHGQYDLSQQMYRHTLKGRTKVLGKEHPNTLTSMNNLALVFQRQGKYDAAELLYQETLS